MIQGFRVIAKDHKPNYKEKSCFDCDHCRAYVTWWCTNREAVLHRGTNVPGTTGCNFWKPVPVYSHLSFYTIFKLYFDDYVIYI